MSCLITDHRQYENVDYPPSIAIAATVAPMTPVPNAINVEHVDSIMGPDGGTVEIAFDVIVRDPNVDQRLTAQWFVNQSTPARLYTFETVRTSGEVDRRYNSFTLPLTDLGLMPGCKKVELCVSSDFAGPCTPTQPDDIARMTFWFAAVDTSTSDVNMIPGVMGCP